MILIKTSVFWAMTTVLFYRTIWALFPLFPFAYWFYRMLMKELCERKEQEFRLEFKETIMSLAAQLAVGYSVENAWKETKKDLSLIYREDSRIMKELSIMLRQLRIQMPMEQVMNDFAERVQVDDVQSFVTVFVAAKKNGGDMLRIIQDTVSQISEKIEMKREISTILASKKYEFRVMTIIPYGIIAYMSLSFPEFMDALYGNLIGIGVMTGCLLVYLGAYSLGMGMINIEL
ncbi:MAG: type II secretion system protein F [Dorea sp.]|nr:type II secretion system protein F [Dorea sp.]